MRRQGRSRRAASYQLSRASCTGEVSLARRTRGGRRSGVVGATRIAVADVVRRRGTVRQHGPRPAATGSGGEPARGRYAAGVLADVLERPPDLADLVAQAGGVLEAQLVGRGEHLLLELDDGPLELLRRHRLGPRARAPLGAAAALRRLALGLEELRDVADALDDRRGRDAVVLVVLELDRAAAVGLLDRRAHRRRLLVGVHQDRAVDVAGGAPDRLDQGGLPAQEALLVGVEDRRRATPPGGRGPRAGG